MNSAQKNHDIFYKWFDRTYPELCNYVNHDELNGTIRFVKNQGYTRRIYSTKEFVVDWQGIQDFIIKNKHLHTMWML